MRGTMRAGLFAALVVCGTAAAVGAPAAAGAATEPTPSPTTAADTTTGPTVVEVPFEGELEVKPAPGWAFADCGPLREATPLVIACAPDGFTVASPGYDPELAPVRVAVPLTSAAASLTVDYVIRLAEPEPPDAPDTDIALPVPAGGHLLVPLSDLGLTCGRCTPGTAQIEVTGVDPASAGMARVTGTHLAFAAASEARGPAEIGLRVTDDIGSSSKIFLVTVHIVAPAPDALVGLHLLRPMETTSFEADDLAYAVGTDDEPRIVGCGEAFTGTVTCSPDGVVTYTPAAGATTDQFSVRLATASGRQALASVTLGTTDASALAPAAGEASVPLDLALPRGAETSEEQAGATTGFTRLMDGLGAL